MLTFDRPTLVTITGPTASGKNFLRDSIEKTFGWNRIVSTTTRPMRAGEVDGHDYYFIDDNTSDMMEEEGDFAELITFRGVRYGVTQKEMAAKMTTGVPATVILEPQGLAIYKALCAKAGWDVFTIYVHTTEYERIRRLSKRTVVDICDAADSDKNGSEIRGDFEKLIATHTDRILATTTEERRWSNQSTWDVIAPGDDLDAALQYVKQGVIWRNRKNSRPTAYTHVDHHPV